MIKDECHRKRRNMNRRSSTHTDYEQTPARATARNNIGGVVIQYEYCCRPALLKLFNLRSGDGTLELCERQLILSSRPYNNVRTRLSSDSI